uniref:Uncharacterized protein n=1 Tax=Chromera velia CCMP2878 TaxID=1169474 RepID=A0A0G4F6K1_9ALVE|eukprot:Cvel_2781.t1-p1 / transcript=Cvel_2781.t1 / gene=Cvel_2781 / organism=Chromera_velia_CCMP2878 / gene_product=Uncharacterized protein DDB_G0274915, putative / transcript_product=Uncharacterized protein DDB_G0274915, putative / location=Cvel_scaffold112:9448-29059(+) / protein_length=2419 / sequence_SO=supercontig / SO=protein_coding / is_pseudo=false
MADRPEEFEEELLMKFHPGNLVKLMTPGSPEDPIVLRSEGNDGTDVCLSNAMDLIVFRHASALKCFKASDVFSAVASRGCVEDQKKFCQPDPLEVIQAGAGSANGKMVSQMRLRSDHRILAATVEPAIFTKTEEEGPPPDFTQTQAGAPPENKITRVVDVKKSGEGAKTVVCLFSLQPGTMFCQPDPLEVIQAGAGSANGKMVSQMRLRSDHRILAATVEPAIFTKTEEEGPPPDFTQTQAGAPPENKITRVVDVKKSGEGAKTVVCLFSLQPGTMRPLIEVESPVGTVSDLIFCGLRRLVMLGGGGEGGSVTAAFGWESGASMATGEKPSSIDELRGEGEIEPVCVCAPVSWTHLGIEFVVVGGKKGMLCVHSWGKEGKPCSVQVDVPYNDDDGEPGSPDVIALCALPGEEREGGEEVRMRFAGLLANAAGADMLVFSLSLTADDSDGSVVMTGAPEGIRMGYCGIYEVMDQYPHPRFFFDTIPEWNIVMFGSAYQSEVETMLLDFDEEDFLLGEKAEGKEAAAKGFCRGMCFYRGLPVELEIQTQSLSGESPTLKGPCVLLVGGSEGVGLRSEFVEAPHASLAQRPNRKEPLGSEAAFPLRHRFPLKDGQPEPSSSSSSGLPPTAQELRAAVPAESVQHPAPAATVPPALFGTPQPASRETPLFGGTPQQTSALFGSTFTPQPAKAGGGLFGPPGGAPTQAVGLFGTPVGESPKAAGGLFGGVAPSTPLSKTAAPASETPKQTPAPSGTPALPLFAGTALEGSGLFGKKTEAEVPKTGTPFGSMGPTSSPLQPAPSGGLFGPAKAFGGGLFSPKAPETPKQSGAGPPSQLTTPLVPTGGPFGNMISTPKTAEAAAAAIPKDGPFGTPAPAPAETPKTGGSVLAGTPVARPGGGGQGFPPDSVLQVHPKTPAVAASSLEGPSTAPLSKAGAPPPKQPPGGINNVGKQPSAVDMGLFAPPGAGGNNVGKQPSAALSSLFAPPGTGTAPAAPTIAKQPGPADNNTMAPPGTGTATAAPPAAAGVGKQPSGALSSLFAPPGTGTAPAAPPAAAGVGKQPSGADRSTVAPPGTGNAPAAPPAAAGVGKQPSGALSSLFAPPGTGNAPAAPPAAAGVGKQPDRSTFAPPGTGTAPPSVAKPASASVTAASKQTPSAVPQMKTPQPVLPTSKAGGVAAPSAPSDRQRAAAAAPAAPASSHSHTLPRKIVLDINQEVLDLSRKSDREIAEVSRALRALELPFAQMSSWSASPAAVPSEKRLAFWFYESLVRHEKSLVKAEEAGRGVSVEERTMISVESVRRCTADIQGRAKKLQSGKGLPEEKDAETFVKALRGTLDGLTDASSRHRTAVQTAALPPTGSLAESCHLGWARGAAAAVEECVRKWKALDIDTGKKEELDKLVKVAHHLADLEESPLRPFVSGTEELIKTLLTQQRRKEAQRVSRKEREIRAAAEAEARRVQRHAEPSFSPRQPYTAASQRIGLHSLLGSPMGLASPSAHAVAARSRYQEPAYPSYPLTGAGEHSTQARGIAPDTNSGYPSIKPPTPSPKNARGDALGTPVPLPGSSLSRLRTPHGLDHAPSPHAGGRGGVTSLQNLLPPASYLARQEELRTWEESQGRQASDSPNQAPPSAEKEKDRGAGRSSTVRTSLRRGTTRTRGVRPPPQGATGGTFERIFREVEREFEIANRREQEAAERAGKGGEDRGGDGEGGVQGGHPSSSGSWRGKLGEKRDRTPAGREFSAEPLKQKKTERAEDRRRAEKLLEENKRMIKQLSQQLTSMRRRQDLLERRDKVQSGSREAAEENAEHLHRYPGSAFLKVRAEIDRARARTASERRADIARLLRNRVEVGPPEVQEHEPAPPSGPKSVSLGVQQNVGSPSSTPLFGDAGGAAAAGAFAGREKAPSSLNPQRALRVSVQNSTAEGGGLAATPNLGSPASSSSIPASSASAFTFHQQQQQTQQGGGVSVSGPAKEKEGPSAAPAKPKKEIPPVPLFHETAPAVSSQTAAAGAPSLASNLSQGVVSLASTLTHPSERERRPSATFGLPSGPEAFSFSSVDAKTAGETQEKEAEKDKEEKKKEIAKEDESSRLSLSGVFGSSLSIAPPASSAREISFGGPTLNTSQGQAEQAALQQPKQAPFSQPVAASAQVAPPPAATPAPSATTPAPTQPPQTSSLFAAAASTPQPQPKQQTGGLFGSTPQPQALAASTPAQQTSISVTPPPSTPTPAAAPAPAQSLFPTQQQQTPQPGASGGLFGSTQPAPKVQGGLFGSAAPPPPKQGTGLFGSGGPATGAAAAPTGGSGLFGNAGGGATLGAADLRQALSRGQGVANPFSAKGGSPGTTGASGFGGSQYNKPFGAAPTANPSIPQGAGFAAFAKQGGGGFGSIAAQQQQGGGGGLFSGGAQQEQQQPFGGASGFQSVFGASNLRPFG